MNHFERTGDPIKSLDLGRERTIKKGDAFEVRFIGGRYLKAIAWDDETFFTEDLKTNEAIIEAVKADLPTSYKVRQVHFNLENGACVGDAIKYPNSDWEYQR